MTNDATVERLAKGLAQVVHDRGLCKASDTWLLLAHAESNDEEDQQWVRDFVAEIVAAMEAS